MSAFTLAFALACAATRHPVAPLEAPAPAHDALEAALAAPVPLEIDVIVSGRWSVPNSGLLDLDDPAASGIVPGDVPIELPVVRVRHPELGAIFIDSGVDRGLAEGGRGPLRGLVRAALGGLEPVVSLGALIDAEDEVAAVLLTHMHLDHVLGLPDVPADVPVIVGPGEGATPEPTNALTRRTYRAALNDRGPLRELDPSAGVSFGGIEGAQDLFGDGSVWALPAPGHTYGSTAYFLNAERPTLALGDASHTCWGWENGVPPGSFSHDEAAAAESFDALQRWAEGVPGLQVIAGHLPCGVTPSAE